MGAPLLLRRRCDFIASRRFKSSRFRVRPNLLVAKKNGIFIFRAPGEEQYDNNFLASVENATDANASMLQSRGVFIWNQGWEKTG